MKTHEAICEMKKGKIVEALFVEQNKLSKDEFNPVIGYDTKKTMSGFYDGNGDDCYDTIVSAISSNVDWKVKEVDWNLADELAIQESHHTTYFLEKDTKKCRDLILKDLDEFTTPTLVRTINVINKRFGDIK